jgi:hypothetical protein
MAMDWLANLMRIKINNNEKLILLMMNLILQVQKCKIFYVGDIDKIENE